MDLPLSLNIPDAFDIALATVVLLLSLPYALYVATNLFNPELLKLSDTRLKLAFAVTILAVFAIGFWAGANNDLIMTCGDFKIAGDDTPKNCLPGPPQTF